MQSINCRFVVLLALATPAATAFCDDSGVRLVKILEWTRAEHEILTPRFSADGTRIALVTRVHWSDGEEAEGLPQRYFDDLDRRRKQNPRFADPVVELLDMNGQTVCSVRYGWNPRISADKDSLVYAEQDKPITGLRNLAETMAGNSIRLYDCKTKRSVEIAKPASGYFDSPIFGGQGDKIVYTVNEATNGAFGGPVAVEKVESNGRHPLQLIPKQTTPAVPCPPKNVTISGRARFLCEHVPHLTSSFARLVHDVAIVGDELIALLGTPQPSPGDTYVAEHYDINLVAVSLTTSAMRPVAQHLDASAAGTALQPLSDGNVMVFSKYWRKLSVQTGGWMTDLGPHNTDRHSHYSRDGNYYLLDGQCGQTRCLTLHLTATGKELSNLPHAGDAYDIVWGDDSRRFAVVFGTDGSNGAPHKETLFVYATP